jgi:small-conductance mechanosensitive channel/CRP-like cAMP-binding protein
MAPMLDQLRVLTDVPLALAIGLAGSALLWPARSGRQGRRALISLWLAVLAAVIVPFIPTRVCAPPLAPCSGPDLPLEIATALWQILAVNAGLQVFDLIIWEGLLSRIRGVSVPRLLINVFNVFVLLAAAVWIVSQVFNLPLSTVVVSSTVVSAVVGLALQDVLRSMVAGIVLQIESPFGLGDWVRIKGYEGRIHQMNWRTVTIRTRENHHVILTNGMVSTDEVLNFSRPASLQGIDAFIGVAYPHPPEQVKAVLKAAVIGTEGVRQTPGPSVFTMGYEDFAVSYRIRYWITDYAALRDIQDAVMTRLWYALKRAGMTIPFPIRDVNLRTIPVDAAEQEIEARQERIAAALKPLPLLAPLSQKQIERVAAGAVIQRFARGEILMQEGEAGSSLLLLCAGCARVEVKGADGLPVIVARRRAGDILGEMSLCTGAARSATVLAEEEIEAIVVGKSAFGEVLLADPTVAEQISEILALREVEQATRVAEAGSLVPMSRSVRDEILGRIRQFFDMSDAAGGQDAPSEGPPAARQSSSAAPE